MKLCRLAVVLAVLAAAAVSVTAAQAPAAAAAPAHPGDVTAAADEVFYHIFVRSFRDSDGDGIGDLDGIRQVLDYLQALGVTSLLLSPIQPSPFYHNYFATSFEGIDPDYGTPADWEALVRAVHARGMKLYLDVEIQYVAEGHPWWAESEGKPGSPWSRFLLYHGPGNTQPESAVYGLTTTPTYDGRSIGLASINLREPAVLEYFQRMLAELADPNGDGRFDDGVDGLRIDHMMDDLDDKGIFTNLFASFWAPIFAHLRALNPRLRIIAEQYDWGYGEDFLDRGGADLVFAFPMRGAIASLDRAQIVATVTETLRRTAPGKGQVVFIENHDMSRFASEVGPDSRRLRLGAALNVLLVGTPSIYYGQELGMRGKPHEGWTADGKDIPDREAFEWTAEVAGPGAALWYRDGGPWWTERFAQDHDGISVAEQQDDPGSLLSWYRRLLALRRARPELRGGSVEFLATADSALLAVSRTAGEHGSVLLFNLADRPLQLPLPALWAGRPLHDALADAVLPASGALELPPYGVMVLVRGPEPGA